MLSTLAIVVLSAEVVVSGLPLAIYYTEAVKVCSILFTLDQLPL